MSDAQVEGSLQTIDVAATSPVLESAVPAGASNSNVIEVQNVGRCYRIYDRPQDRLKDLLFARFGEARGRDFWALKDVSLNVGRGEVLGIVGRNGSGKSTLLQIIAGTLQPTTGQVRTAGRIAALLELGSGFNPEFTGRENVYMNGAILGMPAEVMKERLEDILAFAEIGEFIDQPVKTYSSGMYVRLAFAVAVHVDPEVLVVDEALSVGDFAFQAKCFRRIKEFCDRGVSILLVTHDLGSVVRFCNRAILLDHGHLKGTGDPKSIVDLYKQIVSPAAVRPSTATGAAEGAPAGEICFRDRKSFNPGLLEYGSKDVEIVDFQFVDSQGTPVHVLMTDEPVSIEITAIVRRPVKHPIMAFAIKDLKGVELCGTNTLLEDVELGATAPGDRVTVRMTQRLPLQRGAYTLSLGCTEYVDEGLAVHHRLYDAVIFEVHPQRRFVGVFDVRPVMDVSLKRKDGTDDRC